jgi:hypothetical protein
MRKLKNLDLRKKLSMTLHDQLSEQNIDKEDMYALLLLLEMDVLAWITDEGLLPKE